MELTIIGFNEAGNEVDEVEQDVSMSIGLAGDLMGTEKGSFYSDSTCTTKLEDVPNLTPPSQSLTMPEKEPSRIKFYYKQDEAGSGEISIATYKSDGSQMQDNLKLEVAITDAS